MASFDVVAVIAEFAADSSRTTLTLPPMTTGQRKSTKKFMDQYPELWCSNEGQGSQRRLRVFKVTAATDEEYSKDFMLGWEDQSSKDFLLGWDDQSSKDFMCDWDDQIGPYTSSAAIAKEHSRDFLLAYRAVALPYKEDSVLHALPYKQAFTQPTPETKRVDTTTEDKPLNAMDELLVNCFIQAAKTNQITKQLRLGMPSKGSRIYIECMRPCRPVGSSIDIKTSSFACLRSFFEHLEAKGLVELRAGLNDPVVTNFVWNHPDIVNFTPWPLSTTVLGGSDEPTTSVKSKPGSSAEAAPSVRCKPSQASRSTTSMSQCSAKDGPDKSDWRKDKSSPATTVSEHVIQRLPSPSKARARRQQAASH